jgi:hypothetical protein
LVAYSEQFDNAYWTKQAGTVVTANQTISPDGTQNADLIVGTGNGIFISALTVPSASPNTKSVYLKGVSGGEVVILKDPTQTVNSTICNLTTSWQRFTLTETQSGGVGGLWIDGIQAGGIYVWGAQLEAGAYATSYIPTTSAAVTRVADAASKTGISSLIGQTEGTLFLDFDFTNINDVQVIFSIHDSANNKRLEIWANNNNLNGFIGGSVNIAVGSLNITNGRHKVALAYKQSGEQAFYIDGVQIGTSSTAYTIAALTALSYDYWLTAGYPPTAAVRQTLLFKTRLTNAQLAELTTL